MPGTTSPREPYLRRPPLKTMQIRLSPRQLERLNNLADLSGLLVSELIRRAIDEYLNTRREEIFAELRTPQNELP